MHWRRTESVHGRHLSTSLFLLYAALCSMPRGDEENRLSRPLQIFHSIDLHRMMPDLKLFLPLFFLVASTLVHSKEEEVEDLLEGINGYRKSLNLAPLTENGRAGCLADEIAERLKNQPCSTSTYGINLVPGTCPQSTDYPLLLSKCDIGISHTGDGVILPVCVEDLAPSLVLANYTKTQYRRYLSDSNYTGAGVRSEGDWMVVVLSTGSPGGSFARDHGAHPSVSRCHKAVWLVVLLMMAL